MSKTVGRPVETALALTPQPIDGAMGGGEQKPTYDPFETVGDSVCSAWRCGPGVVRIQVRDADLADELDALAGGKRSGYSVGGDYLMLYDFEKSFGWARNWVDGHMVDRRAEPRRGRKRRPYSDRKGRNG
jgi:hypothetical protein